MPSNNDFKRKSYESAGFAPSILRRTVTAVICFSIIAAANGAGGEKIRAYTAAFGRALRNNSFGIDSIESVKATAERLYRMIPSDKREEGGTAQEPSQNDGNINGDTDNPMSGITFQ